MNFDLHFYDAFKLIETAEPRDVGSMLFDHVVELVSRKTLDLSFNVAVPKPVSAPSVAAVPYRLWPSRS